MHKIKIDWNKYKNNETIPNWTKYKFHCLKLCITDKSNTVTHSQSLITCVDRFYYSDNIIPIGVSMYEYGFLKITSSNQNIIDNTYITEIYMWN